MKNIHSNPLQEKIFQQTLAEEFIQKRRWKNTRVLNLFVLLEGVNLILFLFLYLVFALSTEGNVTPRIVPQMLLACSCLCLALLSKKIDFLPDFAPQILLIISIVTEIEIHNSAIAPHVQLSNMEVVQYPIYFLNQCFSALQIICFCFLCGSAFVYNLYMEIVVFFFGLTYLYLRTCFEVESVDWVIITSQVVELMKIFEYFACICYLKDRTHKLDFMKQFGTTYSESIWDHIQTSTGIGILMMNLHDIILFNKNTVNLLGICASSASSTEYLCERVYGSLTDCVNTSNDGMFECVTNENHVHANLKEAISHFLSEESFHICETYPVSYSVKIKTKVLRLLLYPMQNQQEKTIIVMIQDISTQHLIEEEKANFVAKTKLLASISHQLKTPMNGIILSLGELRDKLASHEDSALVQIVYANFLFLSNYINNITDFTELQIGQFFLEQSHFNLNKIISEVLDILSFEIQQKGLEVKVDIASTVPKNILADRQRVKQILMNILMNAVRYTTQGKISLSITTTNKPFPLTNVTSEVTNIYTHESLSEDSEKPNLLLLTISDTGKGIKPQDLPFIFSVFSWKSKLLEKNRIVSDDILDNETMCSKYQSMLSPQIGLKLTLTKMLVEKMQGEISVSSKVNEGTKVSFSLPINSIPKFKSEESVNQHPPDSFCGEENELMSSIIPFNSRPSILRKSIHEKRSPKRLSRKTSKNGNPNRKPQRNNKSITINQTTEKQLDILSFPIQPQLIKTDRSIPKKFIPESISIQKNNFRDDFANLKKKVLPNNQRSNHYSVDFMNSDSLSNKLSRNNSTKKENSFSNLSVRLPNCPQDSKNLALSLNKDENSKNLSKFPLDSIKTSNDNDNNQDSVVIHMEEQKYFNFYEEEKSSSTPQCVCPNVLVVDDDPFILKVIPILLEKEGFSCQQAVNGRKAIEAVQEKYAKSCCKKFKFILMDCNMPEMNGFEATKELKNLMDSQKIPKTLIIGHSAVSEKKQEEECIQAGMDGFGKNRTSNAE